VQQHYGSPYLRRVSGVVHTLPWTGALFLMATFAVTGLPPFSLFQSEFTTLSAGLTADRPWPSALFIAGIVAIFAGFLVHMSKLTLGKPAHDAPRGVECPWKLSAMLFVAGLVIALGLVLPAPVYGLVQRAAQIIAGTP
jgi:hydrogenase-4 component F